MKNQIASNNRVIFAGGLSAALVTLALLAVVGPAAGQPIYRTGFEPPLFVAGVPLAGQDGWVAPPPLSPNAAMVTTDKPRQGTQTVRVRGADLEHQDFINAATGGYYDAIGSYRHTVNFDTGGNQAVCVSAHVRLDGPRTPGVNFFSASVAAIADSSTGPSGVGELALSSDGFVHGYSSQDLVPTFLVSAPVSLNTWHELAIVVDFSSRTYSFFVDDDYLGTFAFDPSADSNTLRRGSLIAYTGPDNANLNKAAYSAYYDHFAIEAERDSRLEGGGSEAGESSHQQE